MNIILASQSPRRKKLLDKLNLKFQVLSSSIDEKKINTILKAPSKYCIKLAELKCSDISNIHKNKLIIGADTIVYYKNKIIEKPKDRLDAFKQLKLLSNKTHVVYTGVSIQIKNLNYLYNFYEKTYVTFNKVNDKQINYYIDNFHPYDKSGSYGIQDWSFTFVKKINGCFNNVVGFPLSKFYKLLTADKLLNDILNKNKINE
tara:strand:- start:134 stop:739 length:606 start_codon:yes stop_codon:yes gene_type:complete